MFTLGFLRNQPFTEQKKAIFSGCHDASEITRRRRINETLARTRDSTKKIDYHSIQDALRKVRAGGYVVPPKIIHSTKNTFMSATYNKPKLVRSYQGRSPLARHDEKHTIFI